MRDKKKRFKIILLVAALYIVLLVAVVARDKILKINNTTSDSQTETQTQAADSDDADSTDVTDISVNIIDRYNLPSLSRMDSEDQDELVNNLQIIRKIQALNLDEDTLLYPEQNTELAAEEMETVRTELDAEKEVYNFTGSTGAQLQQAIQEHAGTTINITSQTITLDQPIELIDHTYIQGNDVKIQSSTDVKYAFFGEEVDSVSIDGVHINGGFDYGLYVIDSKKISITDSIINSVNEKPVVVVGTCEHIIVENNTFMYNGAGGIYFTGDINYGLIHNNTVSNNYGTSNWMAGIALTNVVMEDQTNIWETFDADHHFPYKENLYGETECPHNIIVSDNTVEYNNASGIYGDGAYMCYFLNNYVNENDKEGICLDYGSFGCYLNNNTFSYNGGRSRQTDYDLQMDFVLDAGRMEDGSSKSKLPGVSLDNTAYDVLINNTVVDNYGGGIKMVRTTVRCLIIENIVKNNNNGANEDFHFFGIELGSAVGDVDSTDMDFTADYENIICRNVISGNHYSGVFIGEEGYVNDIFDNVITQPEHFAVECISNKFNSIVNNISDKTIRNNYESK